MSPVKNRPNATIYITLKCCKNYLFTTCIVTTVSLNAVRRAIVTQSEKKRILQIIAVEWKLGVQYRNWRQDINKVDLLEC